MKLEKRQKDKLERRLKPLTEFTENFINWGGFMPFVPKECGHQKVFSQIQKDGIVYWIDNGICDAKCPNKELKCERWKEYWKNGGKEKHIKFVLKKEK